MATRVILASSTQFDYAFPVGIAALLWRDLVGYEPFVFLCGTLEEWSRPKMGVVNGFLYEMKIETLTVPPLPEWPVHVTAQNVRYHAACLERFDDRDWLMLSDADMFPTTREHFHQHEDYTGRWAFYYANGDHYNNYPTCYMTARAEDWCDLMGISGTGNLLGQMKRNLDEWLKPRTTAQAPSVAGMTVWMSDMHSFMDRIKRQPWHPSECKMIERDGHPPKDRLDRSAWPATYDATKYVDAHILRATHEPANWVRTRPIVEQLIPQHLSRIDRYVEDFRRAQ